MSRIAVAILLGIISSIAYAGDAENIQACVRKAKEFVGVTLNEFEVSYEGKIFAMSTARWKNAYCEVKLGDVYNLQINSEQVIFNGYAGRESYALKKTLDERTEAAVNQLKARIALLEQRMGQVTTSLKMPRPDHAWFSRYIDEGIEKATGVRRQSPGAASSPMQDYAKKAVAQVESRQSAAALVQPTLQKPTTVPEVRQNAAGEIEGKSGRNEVLIPRSIAGDKGTYYLLDSKRAGPIVQTLHKRVGTDSVGYTKAEINCQSMQMRVIGYSEES